MKPRQILLTLHGSIGIFIGVFVMVIGLTGSLLVFRQSMDPLTQPAIMEVIPEGERLPIDTLMDSLGTAFPEGTLEFIELPEEVDKPYTFQFVPGSKNHIHMYINPYSGQVLGIWNPDRTVMGFLFSLHYSLLAGEIGEGIVGLCGFLMVILGSTGIILWPGWKNLKSGLKLRWRSTRQLLSYDLHKVTGIFFASILILLGLTGFLITLLHLAPPLVALIVDFPDEPELAALPPNAQPLPLGDLLQRAEQALPGGRVTGIHFSGETNREVYIRFAFPEDPIPEFRMSHVSFDRFSGEILAQEKVVEWTPQLRFAQFLVNFHFGRFWGVTSQVIYVIAGLTPTLFAATGWVLWQRRRWQKVQRQKLDLKGMKQ
jgi:uncharacterized iron-regulated membrane protein